MYVKPGATFGKYNKVAILDCFVEFDKNWQNNYNQSQVDPSNFVSSDDMNRIKRSWLRISSRYSPRCCKRAVIR